jgi:hypothetical protein
MAPAARSAAREVGARGRFGPRGEVGARGRFGPRGEATAIESKDVAGRSAGLSLPNMAP